MNISTRYKCITSALPLLLTCALIIVEICQTRAAARAKVAGATARLMRVDDVFLYDRADPIVGKTSVSPDGSGVAIVAIRSNRGNDKTSFSEARVGQDTDVWLATPSGEQRRITNGQVDGSRWWRPIWSPGGRYLALLSQKDGTSSIWIWDRDRNSLRKASDRPISSTDTYRWLDGQNLIYVSRPPASIRRLEEPNSMTPYTAYRGWEDARRGLVPTASVLDAGGTASADRVPERHRGGSLLRFNALASQSTVLLGAGVGDDWSVSPCGCAVANIRRTGSAEFDPKVRVSNGRAMEGTFTVDIWTANKGLLALPPKVDGRAIATSVRWSRDGRDLGFAAQNEEGRLQFILVDVDDGRIDSAGIDGLDPTPPPEKYVQYGLLGRRTIYFRASSNLQPGTAIENRRRDWWLRSENGDVRNLTADLATVPESILADPGSMSFYGLSSGDIWRFDGLRRSVNLTGSTGQIARIVWPATDPGTKDFAFSFVDSKSQRIVIKRAEQTTGCQKCAARPKYFTLALQAGRAVALSNLGSSADLSDYDPDNDRVYFRRGDQIIRVGADKSRAVIFQLSNDYSTETFLEPHFRRIDYKSEAGEPLTGWLMLPPDYDSARSYPMVTWVYQGTTFGTSPPTQLFQGLGIYDMRLAAAHGYVVLLPSMPRPPRGVTWDPMLTLSSGVLPAVDKAIELGVADPNRLLLAGHSFGGFSTYGLLTMTGRFKAAIAAAGPSDFTSLFGTLSGLTRYNPDAQDDLFQIGLTESGQASLGGPPWEATSRYFRNSPVNFVDRISTPLMIVQGDLDYVPLQQGEQMFRSLARLGRRVEFVRYWGEGHVPTSPANVRDFWSRFFSWFDEFADVSRDADGKIIFQGGTPKSRGGSPPMTPADFLKLPAIFDQRFPEYNSEPAG